MEEKNKPTVVAVSGGFDPIHIGHLKLLEAAKALGDKLVVILNNDNWLTTKKGFAFLDEQERLELLKALCVVDEVYLTKHEKNDLDRSVSKALTEIKPDIFANGGDRDEIDAQNPKSSLYKDIKLCEELGIEMVFNVGAGGKIQSSSWLTGKIVGKGIIDERPWGEEEVLKMDPKFWLKTLTLNPGQRFSLQTHSYRSEVWVCVDGTLTAEIDGVKKELAVGDIVVAKEGQKHRLGSEKGGTIVEVAYGERMAEDDFVRHEDDYGRS